MTHLVVHSTNMMGNYDTFIWSWN